MADTESQAQGKATETEAAEFSLLDRAIEATKQTEPDYAKDMLKTLTAEAVKGTVTFDKNLTVTLTKAVEMIDRKLSKQLAEVMHHPKFVKLEGSWRGMHHLVYNSETGPQLKIKMINASQRDLYKDLTKASEFDQSTLWKKLYENEFGMPGGEPYGALIGDYEFTAHQEDVELLGLLSKIAAASFAPFISAAGPGMFGFNDFTELATPRDLSMIFESKEHTSWRGFRDSEDSRFVCLTMPKVLARAPYGEATKRIDEFDYEESVDDAGRPAPLKHEEYCWMNSAYVMGARLTDSFAQFGWCTSIRGAENGGKVTGLPLHFFPSEDGDTDQKCPTEVGIADRREAELSSLGFLPLCHYKNTDYAVFFGGQSTQKPKIYDRDDATANARLSARLPYLMATSRFAHYLKIMARDKIGSFMEATDCEKWLNRWIMNYVNSNPNAGPEMKAKFPLRDAKVEVKEVPGEPGHYNAVAYLRPWLQLEELTASMRLVARIPEKSG
ncbi:MAG: type VI secretion system contractile sheath large subunit [Rhodospirillaceae bacterium]|nr:type VI secretion system contractile sheath large subunit [Rhodospirillaceae bacterium]MCA8932015.1 type VI secretion system contractile sheath large subunit [Rhodospirillaceae bacterium]